MFAKKAIQFAALFSALNIMACSAQDCGTPEVTCETSDASPDWKDADSLNEFWREVASGSEDSCGDAGCAQPHGSGCHQPWGDGGGTTATIALCQDDSSSSTPVCGDCRCIGGYFQAVLDQCESNGKVGGYAHVAYGDNYINYEFIHS